MRPRHRASGRSERVGCVVVLALGGCAQVAPHERATLARPDMELGADADLRYGQEHAQSYREGSSGGGSVKAGGCGCG